METVEKIRLWTRRRRALGRFGLGGDVRATLRRLARCGKSLERGDLRKIFGKSANFCRGHALASRTRPRERASSTTIRRGSSSVLRPECYATINGAIGWVPVSTNLRILALRVIAEAECDLEP